MKVLFWMNTPTFGGTERMNLRIIRGLDKIEFQVDALFFRRDKPDLLAEFQQVCGSVDFADELGIQETIRRLRSYDVIYAFGLKGNILARFFKIISPKTRVLSSLHSVIPHTDLARKLPIYLDKLTWRIADDYVSNSHSSILFLQRNYHYPSRYSVVEHGIDVGEFEAHPLSFDLRGRFRMPDDARVVVTVGSYNRIKNHVMLLKAHAAMRRDDLWTFCIGKGPLRDELEGFARARGISGRVFLLSEELDVISFLKQADLFVSTSLIEGLPGTLMEALACEVPVVATDVYGNDQIVTNGETGLTVPPGDSAALAESIARLLDDRAYAMQLAANGKRLIETRFSMARMVSETAALLRDRGRG